MGRRYEVVPFKAEHGLLVDSVRGEEAEAILTAQVTMDYLRWLEETGPAWTGMDSEGGLIAAGGVVLDRDTGTAWLISTHRADMYKVSLHKYARDALVAASRDYGLRVIRAYVRCGSAMASKWARSLGFGYEAIVQWGPHMHEHIRFVRWFQ